MTDSAPSRIYYMKPSITEREISYVSDAATYGRGKRCYKCIGRFEQALSVHLGSAHTLATSNCTGSLKMRQAVRDSCDEISTHRRLNDSIDHIQPTPVMALFSA